MPGQDSSTRIRKPRSAQPEAHNRPSRRRVMLVVSALLILISLLFVYWPKDAAGPALRRLAESGSAGGYNVLLVTLDTLRADRLGCYGYQKAVTPVIDRLAREGVRFEQAVTAVPITLPSHATIMTGRYPPRHGVRDNGTFHLPPEQTTLAETLQGHGYATAAFIAAFVLDARYGLDQGFDHYDDDLDLRHRLPTPIATGNPERPADVVVDSALAWLDTHNQQGDDRPFFMWVHLFDAHAPYAPPTPMREQFGDRPYDGEIAFVDQQLGRLLDGLKERGHTQDTLIAVVGDHGEGLNEHDEPTHRQLIYESTMAVPLILWRPGVLPARVVNECAVGTVDLMPTILDLLGVEAPASCDGLSLLHQGLDPRRVIYVESLSGLLNDGWAPLYGARRVDEKYIDAPAPEYFDLRADPHELNNLWSGDQGAASRLANLLDELRERFPPAAPEMTVTPSAEELRKLAALGYVASDVSADPGDSDLDPKLMIRDFNERIRAMNLIHRGDYEGAIDVVRAVLSRSPGSAELWSLLSRALSQAGRDTDALGASRRAVQLQPTKPEHWCDLAQRYLMVGNDQEAEVCLSEAERLHPLFGRIWMMRARQAMGKNLFEQALAHCNHALESDRARSGADSNALAGRIHAMAKRYTEAATAFDAALAIDPRNGAALLGRAKIALRRRQPRRAIDLLGELIEGQQEYLEGGRLLGQTYASIGRSDAAVGILRTVVARDPRDGAAHYELSRIFAFAGKIELALDHLERAAALGTIEFKLLRSDPRFARLVDHPRLAEIERQQGEK